MKWDFNLISKYRSELMGIAILEVLLMHFFSLTDRNMPIIVNKLIQMVYTQGFLFLSGFGIFYSLSKNETILSFYKKRVKRLYIPYWLVFVPVILWYLCTGNYSNMPIYAQPIIHLDSYVLRIIGQITTLSYWIEGNYNGMWYVATTVILYITSPIVYNKIASNKNTLMSFVIFIAFCYAIRFVLQKVTFGYYAAAYNFFNNFQMFYIGMMFAYINKHYKEINAVIAVSFICLLFYVNSIHAVSIASMITITLFLEVITNMEMLPQQNSLIKQGGGFP